MPENTNDLKQANGKPAPQYWDEDIADYAYLKGVMGGPYYTHRGTVAMEAWEGSVNETKTFTSNRYGFSVMNDGTADLTFTINGQTRKVKPGEAYSALFQPFTSVTITASTPYRAEVLK